MRPRHFRESARTSALSKRPTAKGKIDLLKLVVVQNDLVDAEFSYIESLWDYWRAVVALERAVAQTTLAATQRTVQDELDNKAEGTDMRIQTACSRNHRR